MTCPYCAEKIKDEAIVCPQCKRDLAFFKPLDQTLQAIDSELKDLTEHVSRISVFLDQQQTGGTKEGETASAPKLKTPTKWRVFLMVLSEFVLLMGLLAVFILCGADLVPRQESYYDNTAEQPQPSPSPTAIAQSTPAAVSKSENKLQPNSLCATEERAIFSCAVEGSAKIVSVCASKDLARDSGYLQYRFGLPGKIELEYPKDRKGTQQKFQYSHYPRAMFALKHIHFNIDGDEYEVFDDSEKVQQSVRNDRGVMLDAPGKPTEVIYCGAKTSADYTDLQSVLPVNESEEKEEALRQQQWEENYQNQQQQFNRRIYLALKIFLAAAFVLPIALGLWMGLEWHGKNLKRYVLVGLLCGSVEGAIVAFGLSLYLIIESRGATEHFPGKFTFPIMFAALFILIDLFRCVFGFATGGLLGDWWERRRYPQLYSRGFSDLMALKLSNRTEQVGRFGRVTQGLGSLTSSVAPLIPLMGVLITSVLGFYAARAAKTANDEKAAKTAAEEKEKNKAAAAKPAENAPAPSPQPSTR